MGKSELLPTLGDFTSKENWDNFFTIRGEGDAFEWYAEWAELRDPLLSQLSSLAQSSSPQILVPGCGNSRLSEDLYDAGFHSITNIDFSKVAISNMLRRNVRQRPDMRWRIMDMTNMQFMDGTFDAVLDKGALDSLMEPEHGPQLGSQYLSEVKRIMKSGGKFICLTLAESHVLGLLFSKFRLGWRVGVHTILHKQSSKPKFRTFMVIAEKDDSSAIHQIKSFFNPSSLECNGDQACGLNEALDKENIIRREYCNGADISYSLEDLELGAKGDLKALCPGRRFKLTLGGDRNSVFSYRAVLLDARKQSGPFVYQCSVFIVPKARAHEWLFSSEEGQWMVVESSKAARLIMVLLDKSHSNAKMDIIQKDLSPLVSPLAPEDVSGAQIPFMMASDGIKQRTIVHKVTSPLTGPVVVEDVVYENDGGNAGHLLPPSGDLAFRRLVFQRTEGLVQSEALLTKDESSEKVSNRTTKKTSASSKSKTRGAQKQATDLSGQLKVYHGYVASSYHTGIVSGFMLVSSYIESVAYAGKKINVVVVGLGAGLLPMFLNSCIRCLHIEVVELDPVIFSLARDYFGFSEDKHLKVHIADGIQFVREAKASASTDATCVANGNGHAVHLEGRGKIDALIIDVDSSDSSSGMTCPAADFVEESFLQTAKETLSEQGLFVVNLVTRSPAINDMVVSRMKGVFSKLFSLQLEEDVNEVLFALPSDACVEEDSFPAASQKLEKLLELKHPEMTQSIMEATKKIRCLK